MDKMTYIALLICMVVVLVARKSLNMAHLRQLRVYKALMWKAAKMDERITAGCEGRIRPDAWGYETRREKRARLARES